MKMKAKNISGMAIAPRLNDPSNESAKIQAVTVVPMLAPIITPIAFARARSPALTKLTSIRVVAVDDWTSAVTKIPVSTHLNLLEVICARNARREFPASFWSPPDIRDIP